MHKARKNKRVLAFIVAALILSTACIKNANGSALFSVEEGMHEQSVIITMEHLMDGIIQTKKEGEKTLVKAMGINGFSDWTILE